MTDVIKMYKEAINAFHQDGKVEITKYSMHGKTQHRISTLDGRYGISGVGEDFIKLLEENDEE